MTSQPFVRPDPRPPSVERVAAAVRSRADVDRNHDVVVDAVRSVIDDERDHLAGGADPRPIEDLAAEALDRLDALSRSGIARVINATGVIIHTNLGRAPWPAAAEVAARGAMAYLPLEIDQGTGRRGARFRIAEEHLIALTGGEDAFITNNNAAAVALACALAGRGGVVVSRGELVEIGGGVRIPEIIRRAGA
jgi:L-seryl-tRNA(Ser) seleniumtransferase